MMRVIPKLHCAHRSKIYVNVSVCCAAVVVGMYVYVHVRVTK